MVKLITVMDKRILFILVCVLSALLTYISQRLLIGDELYYTLYGEQLNVESINKLLVLRNKWQWVSYSVIPILFLVKLSCVALCLNIGCLLLNYQVSFKKLFQISLIADTIFLVPGIMKIIWFWKFQPNFTLHDILYFSPFSLLVFFDTHRVEPWFIYPLQVVNIFEILYWFAIAYGLKLLVNKPLGKTLGLVVCSYGTGLTVWVTFMIFIQLNYS